MNLIAFIIALFIFCLILAGIFWIGFYVVLPIVLVCVLLSAIGRVWQGCMPNVEKKHLGKNKKIKQNQVIDVEFEEIKE